MRRDEKIVRREPGRGGKILRDHRQEVNVAVLLGGIGNLLVAR